MHRGYHGLAMPMWERKIRVFSGWIANVVFRRDVVSIDAVKKPRLAFETWAARAKN
jgi:NADH dehydrogenase